MSKCAACDKQITDRSTIVTFGSSKYHPRCAASDPRDAELATLREQLADAVMVVGGMREYDKQLQVSESFDCNHYEPPCKCGAIASEIDRKVEDALSAVREALRDYDAKHIK